MGVQVRVMEFIIIVLAAILIVSCVYEFGHYWLKRIEDKREQERIDCYRRKRDR